jgi:HAD superfamily hydrolase (TIGR01509 family)
VPALIFDCDGVLADTERDGHRPAFNQAFAEAGLDVAWDEEEYGRRLKIGGGKERIASLFDDPEAERERIAALHKRKTALYKEIVRSGRLPGRPGIARVVDEALAAGWTLAVASTSAEESVRAVLEHAVGKRHADRIELFAGDAVPAKKPDPGIYLLALERTGSDPRDTLAIEDSRNGMLAAVGAGLRCLVTVSSYTREEDFSEAVLVVSSLGDADEPTRVLANRSEARPGDQITLDDLRACLRAPISQEVT